MEASRGVVTAEDMTKSTDPAVRAICEAMLAGTHHSELDYFGLDSPDDQPSRPETAVEAAHQRAARLAAGKPAVDFVKRTT